MKTLFFLLFSIILTFHLNAQDAGKIKSSTISYMSGNDSVTAYFAVPDKEGQFPALIVIHEWWGLDEWIKKNADMFAEKGYAALAIDLYRGKVADSPETAHEIMRALPEDRAVKDLKAAYKYLSSLENVDQNNIGSIGWCMGGSYSLQTVLSVPDLDAAVIVYGRLVTEEESLLKINTPLLGIFGEDDKGIPPADVRAFETSLKNDNKDVNVIIYPDAGHAFMNQNNKSGYNAAAAEKAWQEIFSFLDKHLKENKE